jgi:hypothetical protein
MIRTIVYNNTYVQGLLVGYANNQIATVDVFGKQYTGRLVPSIRKN